MTPQMPIAARCTEGPRILVAGIGNIFRGDDGFGVEVARRLSAQTWPQGVRVVDFGMRGFDLANALAGGWDFAILIDAAPRGAAPGTLYVIEPELKREGEAPAEPRLGGSFALPAFAPGGALDGHGLDPVRVLALASSLGGPLPRILVVGCEPMPPEDDADVCATLSPSVRAAVEESLTLVGTLIDGLRRIDPRGQFVSLAALFEGRTDNAGDSLQAHWTPG